MLALLRHEVRLCRGTAAGANGFLLTRPCSTGKTREGTASSRRSGRSLSVSEARQKWFTRQVRTHQPMMELHSSRTCFLWWPSLCLWCFDCVLCSESDPDVREEDGCAEAKVAISKSEAAIASSRTGVEERYDRIACDVCVGSTTMDRWLSF